TQYHKCLGIRSADIARTKLHLEGNAVLAALDRKLSYFMDIVKQNGIRAIPHAAHLVRMMNSSKIRMGLATSSRKEKMTMVMKETGLLSYFDVIVTGDEVLNGKPAPDIFLKAAERLGVAPPECLVFEDAVSGVRAAKNAGMQCIAITTTHSADVLQEADLIINSFEELENIALCYQPA
ncbi:MAG: HAD family phosphatase, partial [Chitinophagaceae bacterium]|nr:HAD family phosphatase [Chitinophagaceae bacterium]